MTRSNYF